MDYEMRIKQLLLALVEIEADILKLHLSVSSNPEQEATFENRLTLIDLYAQHSEIGLQLINLQMGTTTDGIQFDEL